MSPRQVFRIAKRAQGTLVAKRIHVNQVTIPDVTATDFDNPLTFSLVEAVETMDETVESDGAGAVADVPLYSRLVGMRLHTVIRGGANSEVYRWILLKNIDGDTTISNLQGNTFHTSNEAATDRELRKETLAKGEIHISNAATMARVPVFIKRAALKRNGSFKEGDLLTFAVAKNAAGSTGLLSMWGNLYFKTP